MGLFRAASPEGLRDAPFTYAEVGATRASQMPAGYLHGEWTEVVGTPPHVCPVEVQLQPQRTA